uniref:Uncharacterized protein n=1 Tax=Aotus nancymaae TaxID=37293 RepID=A0A2K5EZ52_AOTNA
MTNSYMSEISSLLVNNETCDESSQIFTLKYPISKRVNAIHSSGCLAGISHFILKFHMNFGFYATIHIYYNINIKLPVKFLRFFFKNVRKLTVSEDVLCLACGLAYHQVQGARDR